MVMPKCRMPRRTHAYFVAAIVGVNIVYFLTLGGSALSRIAMKNLAIREHTTNVSSDQPSGQGVRPNLAIANAFMTPTVSPKMKEKIDIVRNYLNETKASSARNPANIIGRYLMGNPDMCKGVSKVDVIILVHTAPPNLEKRQRMRDSFAKDSLFFPFHVRIAFLLGRTTNTTLQRLLWLEHVAYNDTVMGDFIDHYHNLTLKGVMGYRWVSEHCTNSNFVLKIDDDVLINMYKLLYSYTGHMHGKKKSIFCNVWSKSSMGILREGKWKVAKHLFSNMTSFPYDYCSGFVVILTSDLMRPLYEAAKMTPFFWIDDVYLFGILPKVVGGVTYYNYALQRNVSLVDKEAVNCTTTQGPRCPIFATIIRPNMFWSYWNMIQNLYSSGSWKVEQRTIE